MRGAALLLVLPLAAGAQIGVEVTGTTATQAILQIRGATTPCVIDLRQGSPDGPLHPDATASTDTDRPDTITWQDGTRIVTLGHQRSNLALAADREYYGTVSGCGDATFQFQTGTPALGAHWPPPLPFNAAKPNNIDYPDFDWSVAGRNKVYVDPVTGIEGRPVNTTGDFGYRSPLVAFDTFDGGVNWTDPNLAIKGSTSSVATVTTTDHLDLYASTWFTDPVGTQTWDNLGLVVWGSGSGSAQERTIEACIFLDPVAGCAGTPIQIVLPSGSPVKLTTGSPLDNDKPFPVSFPYGFWEGWNASVFRDNIPVSGTINTAVDGLLTISSPTAGTHFPATLKPGHKIRIPGVGCANDLCTVSSLIHAGQLQLVEPVNGTSLAYAAYPVGIRIRKATEGGSVRVGFQYKVSGSAVSATIAETIYCHPVEATAADGVKGHTCAIPSANTTYRMLYFISNDGLTVRRIGDFNIPEGAIASMYPSQDRPHSSTDRGQGPIGFSQTDPRVFYVVSNTTSSGPAIFKLTYTGDFVTETTDVYPSSVFGSVSPLPQNMTWENMLRASEGKDLASLVTAAYPSYNAAVYGSWTLARFAGISGAKAFFYNLYGGQDGGPCWIAGIDIEEKRLDVLVHTLDGSTTTPIAWGKWPGDLDYSHLAWGNCHSIAAVQWPPNTVGISLNALAINSTSKLHGGPFEVAPNALMRNGAWSTNTALPSVWDGNYDGACPSDLTDEYKEFGATDNDCVTLKLPGHPCNIRPTATERANFPACAWDPAFTQPAQMRPGHKFINPALPGGGDQESFRVLRIEPLAGGELKVIAQRNVTKDYCCIGRPGCVNNAVTQHTHANGWKLRMMPGSEQSCRSATVWLGLLPDSPQAVEATRTIGCCHAAIGRYGDNITHISFSRVIRDMPVTVLSQTPIPGHVITFPRFDGVSAGGSVPIQQYLSYSQFAAMPGDPETAWALDGNAYNPSFGYGGGNTVNNNLGSRSLTKINNDVWKIGVIGAIDYKRRPLYGWVRDRILRDVSGPSSDIASAEDYAMCHALRAGECVAGSAAGDTYVKAPAVYPHNTCTTAMTWANIPCVTVGQPGVGGIRQLDIANPYTDGSRSRFLTYGFAAPGLHYPFFGPVAHPSGKSVLTYSGQHLGNVRQSTLVFRLPSWRPDALTRNRFGGVTVQVPPLAGATHARVRFGYNRSLQCTTRNESCVTDETAAPFAFETDPNPAPTPCTEGCEIAVPAISGRVLYYRAEFLANGQVMETGETTALVVP
jgi:hypothetical protein